MLVIGRKRVYSCSPYVGKTPSEVSVVFLNQEVILDALGYIVAFKAHLTVELGEKRL